MIICLFHGDFHVFFLAFLEDEFAVFVDFTLLFAMIYVVLELAEGPGFNLIGVGNSPPFFRDEETITTVYKQFSALKVLSSTILTFCTFRQFPVALEITCFYRFVIGSGRHLLIQSGLAAKWNLRHHTLTHTFFLCDLSDFCTDIYNS